MIVRMRIFSRDHTFVITDLGKVDASPAIANSKALGAYSVDEHDYVVPGIHEANIST